MVKRNELIKFIYQTIGNNATIIKRLGAKITGQFWGEGWGFIAKFAEPQSLTALKNKCAKIFNHEISSFLVSPPANCDSVDTPPVDQEISSKRSTPKISDRVICRS